VSIGKSEESENSHVIFDGEGITLSASMKKQESPQDYINRVMQELGLSHRRVAERARKLGHKLSAGYVHNIASGIVDNPSIRLVQAIAAGLGKPEDELFAMFRGKQLIEGDAYRDSLFGVLGAEFNCLSPQDQKELRPAVDMLHHEILRRLK
jgi:transcriptional regulator with XRE-family HTH domain